jgi:hypothetical protein
MIKFTKTLVFIVYVTAILMPASGSDLPLGGYPLEEELGGKSPEAHSRSPSDSLFFLRNGSLQELSNREDSLWISSC